MNDHPDPTLAELEKWFNSAQDRAQQWFTTNTRGITVVAAIITAFVLQLDAFTLLHRVSSDADLRSKLVAHADSLQKDAEKVFQNSDVGDKAAHDAIIKELREKHPDIANTFDKRPDFTSMSEVDKWMRDKLKENKDADEIVADYKQIFAQRRLGSAGESFEKINTAFKKTGLELLPQPYPPIFAKRPLTPWWKVFSGEWSWPGRHLLGILTSAALLSLGAPFWFNALKNLTNLRPTLAQEIEKEPKQAPKKPASEKTSGSS
jgi:hypothetical protein